MKYLPVLLLLNFSSNDCFSQISYDDFVHSDNKIQWAADYTQLFEITSPIRRFGMKQILCERLEKKGCIEYYSVKDNKLYKNNFCKGDTWPLTQFGTYTNPRVSFASEGEEKDQITFKAAGKTCYCNNQKKENRFDIYLIRQVIFYRSGKLQVKNIMASPTYLKRNIDSAAGKYFIWESPDLSLLDNSKEFTTARDKTKMVDYGNSEQVYDLKYTTGNVHSTASILTLKNPMLIKHLLDDLFAQKITAVDDYLDVIPVEYLTQFRNPQYAVPVFDTMGNIIEYRKMWMEMNMDKIYEYGISQHFYFDTVINTLYSVVNFVDVYRNVYSDIGLCIGRQFYFRVYFTPPSLYKKPKVRCIYPCR